MSFFHTCIRLQRINTNPNRVSSYKWQVLCVLIILFLRDRILDHLSQNICTIALLHKPSYFYLKDQDALYRYPRSTTDHGNNFNKSKITSLDHLVVTPVQPKQWEKYQTSQTCSAEICISTWRWWLHWLFTWCHSTPSRGRVFTKFSHYQNSFNHFLLKRRSSRRTLKYSDFSALCLPMSKTLSRVAVFSPRTA